MDRPQTSLAAHCFVCDDAWDENNRPQRSVNPKCKHEIKTCTRCLKKHIDSELARTAPEGIEYPDCKDRLGYYDVKDFAASDTFEKYNRFPLNLPVLCRINLYPRYDNILFVRSLKELVASEKFQECANRFCEFGQICDPGECQYIECDYCTSQTCIDCDTLWHPGQSCEERRPTLTGKAAKDAESAESQRYIDANCRQCPKCKAWGSKTEGCDRIICKSYQFIN